jgi:hypothetical protein
MADDVVNGTGPRGALQRPRFSPGDYLGARDLAGEQDWRRQRLRRHNRYLHGWGIVCGLWVAPAREGTRPWAVVVCPGYALGPYGDEILVGCAARVDLREWMWSRPADEGVLYVAIRHSEASGSPRRYRAADCDCDDRKTRHSMITEHYRIDVLWTMPDPGKTPDVDLCHDVPGCVPCPPTPYVLLARVRLPPDESTAIRRTDIDLSVRRLV